MDTLTYSWLISNKIVNEQSKIIDCLLILSSNNILISINNLIEYCKSAPNKYLNNEQFQILNDNINSYCVNNTSPISSSTTDSLITNHNIIDNNNNTKFDCSIILIIENNKQILKIIKNRKISNNKKNDEIFLNLIWRNSFIRNEIFTHLRLFNIHQNPIVVKDLDKELLEYKLNGYLKSIHIENTELLIDNLLPDGLESISFSILFNQEMIKGMIPDSVTSIDFNYGHFNQTLDGNWLPKSLKSLKFSRNFQQSIKVGNLPESLTELKLHDDYNGIIQVGAIPKSLFKSKERFGYYKFNSEFNTRQLSEYSIPKSTTCLKFDREFNKPLKKYDIPDSVTSLCLNGYTNEIERNVLPNSILELTMKNYNHDSNYGNVLPPNLTSLYINIFTVSPIQETLSKNITTLKIYGLDAQIDAINLLPNLTTLEIKEMTVPFNDYTSLFPISLTSLKIECFLTIPVGFFINHTNLKTLDLETSQVIPQNTLPHSITSLRLYFYKDNDRNPFQNIYNLRLLEKLEIIANFNLSIFDFSKLQSSTSLTSLTFGDGYNQPINDGVLPINLKELSILDPSFDKYIPTSTDNNQLPASLQSITISPVNHKFLNNLNLNFISKYIKYDKFEE